MATLRSQTPSPVAAPAEGSGRVLAAIVITLLAWASAFIVIRGAGTEFTPGAMALGRLLVGAVCLTVLVLRKPLVRLTRREWVLTIAFGIAWFAAYNVALNTAEQTLDAGTTAMIVNIGPILIAVGAGLVLGEGIPRWLAIGAGVAFFGVLLIGVSAGAHGFDDVTGIFWCLVAAVTYAVGVLCQKPVLRRVSSTQLTWIGCVTGVVACLPYAGDLLRDVSTASAASIVGVAYLGAIPTALAFTTWGFALSRMPAGRLGISTYVVPPLTIVLGLLVFGEVPGPLAVVGGVVCLAGVALSRRSPRLAG
jgi:drug/metabolite transporter (DMT)-like permease